MRTFVYGIRLSALILLGLSVIFAGIRCGDNGGEGFGPRVELLSCPPDTVFNWTPCAFVWSPVVGRISGYFYGLNDDTPETWTTSRIRRSVSPS